IFMTYRCRRGRRSCESKYWTETVSRWKSWLAPRRFRNCAACDALVTGRGRKRHIWKVIGGNPIFPETASDALKSNCGHRRLDYFGPLKIRRYLVPWGFNSPSRHQRVVIEKALSTVAKRQRKTTEALTALYRRKSSIMLLRDSGSSAAPDIRYIQLAWS